MNYYNNDNNKIELESKDLFRVREEMQRLADFYVDRETSNKKEREESKEELEQWLNEIWSNFNGNVILTDNPNFNFNEPIQLREPLDETLQIQLQQKKEQLKAAKRNLEEKRNTLTTLVTACEKEALQAQHQKATEFTVIAPTKPRSEAIKLNEENLKEIERVYDESLTIMSHLEKSVPEQIKKVETIIEIVRNE